MPTAAVPPLRADHDVLAVAEGAVGDAAYPHTPRYEPSWFFEEIREEMLDQCMRERVHMQLDDDEARDWFHKHLMLLGHAANARGHHYLAHGWFECAYCVKGTATELLSSINMRLKLGQCNLAKCLYQRVLSLDLTEPQREVAARKLNEAEEAAAERASTIHGRMEDELEQLILDQPSSLSPADLQSLLRLLRQQGHVANGQRDFESAQLWFDCAWSLSRRPSDLLSAANMRAKLVAASPVAEALYTHLLTLPGLAEREMRMADSKLEQLRQQKAEVVPDLPYGAPFSHR